MTEPRYEDGIWRRVRMRNPLEDVVAEHGVALSPTGKYDELQGTCPLRTHPEGDDTKLFRVAPSDGYWHCFGCGQGGDVIMFIMAIKDIAFNDAVRHLAKRTGLNLEGLA